jgi:hypothetical protein
MTQVMRAAIGIGHSKTTRNLLDNNMDVRRLTVYRQDSCPLGGV